MPKPISVNICTYNRASLLSRSISSIQSQTSLDIEIVVIDDCSSDGTKELIHKLQSQDQRIRYIRHPVNKGLAAARNTGLSSSCGDYIAFMDDDDEWIDPEKLKKQKAILDSDSTIGLVYTGIREFSSENAFLDVSDLQPKNIQETILKGNGFIYSPTVMMRTAAITRIGNFDEKLGKGVDSDIYRRLIFDNSYSLRYLPDITTAIHEHGEDRITPELDSSGLITALSANIRVFRKHFFQYLRFPSALKERLRRIAMLSARLVKSRFSG